MRNDAAEMSAGTLILYAAAMIAAMAALSALLPVIVHLQGQSGTAGHEAAREAATQLDVVDVFGARNSTSADVWDLHVAVELPDGASAIDVHQLVLQYDDGNGVHRTFAHAASALADAAAPASTFNATWTRGAGGATFAMTPGDHVTLHFNLDGAALPARTSAMLELLPETGSATTVTWLTPGTFGADATVLLK